MPFLGERHQSWVNDITHIRLRKLSLKDNLIAMLLALLLVTLIFFTFSANWTQSLTFHRNSWLYLNSPVKSAPDPVDRSWSDESSTSETYWIKSEVLLEKNNGFDAIQVSFPESYQLYWDGYLIGEYSRRANQGVTQLHYLEKHHVLSGRHYLMLRIDTPRSTLLDLSKKLILLGKSEQLRMMAIMKLFLLIGAVGLLGLIILLFSQNLRSLQTRQKTTLWILAITSIYLGLALVDVLHHQPFKWSNSSLIAIATACSLQLVFALSRKIPNLHFKSFFSIAAITYILIYFVLGTQNERLILYFVALQLTLFFFFFTTSTQRSAILWSLTPIVPFLSPIPEIGFLVIALPITSLLIEQLFTIGQVAVPPIQQEDDLSQKAVNYLLVNSKSDKVSIPLETVTLIKAANNYSIIVLQTGKTFLHDKSLLRLSSELPENFKRIHKSYLVNFDQVEQIKNKTGGGKLLWMKNGEEVPVGRVYQKELAIRFA